MRARRSLPVVLLLCSFYAHGQPQKIPSPVSEMGLAAITAFLVQRYMELAAISGYR
ncbi:MAG: hypothetical protein AAF662_11735 [Pseudomonadota bacterium]